MARSLSLLSFFIWVKKLDCFGYYFPLLLIYFCSEHSTLNFSHLNESFNFSKHLSMHRNTVPGVILCVLFSFNFINSIPIISAWEDLKK